jgi:hypothetical protein
LEIPVNLIQVRNKQTKDISHVSEEWLERWPADFTRVDPIEPPKETPSTGTEKKEKA